MRTSFGWEGIRCGSFHSWINAWVAGTTVIPYLSASVMGLAHKVALYQASPTSTITFIFTFTESALSTMCGLCPCVASRVLVVLYQQHDQSGLVCAVQRHVSSHLLAHCHRSLETSATSAASATTPSLEHCSGIPDEPVAESTSA